ncbi:hypothetical protein [Methylobacterium sp. SD21]|uniref:hypothetical protein n=1 Tax=Methylobacterium litchii TaxID=3138810 RepID=UPI00313AA365
MVEAQLSLDLVQTLSPDEETVHAYVLDILPKGVPSYVRKVSWFFRDRRGFTADLVVFDGGTCRIRVEGPLGAGCYTWANFGADRRPFHWNRRRRRWERVTEEALDAQA